MIPKSMSATALQTADACLARYWAENIVRADDTGSRDAADLGTACHAALELFVQKAVMTHEFNYEFQVLEAAFRMAYMETFDTAEHETDMYRDGVAMLHRWFDRTDWSKVKEVLSCEIKETFPVKTSVGDIPFNYIWDRCDLLEDEEGRFVIRVVDYKTIRVPVTAEQLHSKIQARCYSLAARVRWPQADEIWVSFDLLRHDPVGTRFTREEDAATWHWLKASAERIIAADETDLASLEKLNPECKYCVRQLSCEALDRNVFVGGIASLTGIDEAIDLLGQLNTQMQANGILAAKLEEYVLGYAQEQDLLEWESDTAKVKITAKRTRKVDPSAVARVLGPTLVAQYGRITVTDIDKLVREGRLTKEQETQVQALIYKTTGEPSVKVSPKSPLEEE